MRRFFQIFLPVAVLAVTAGVVYMIIKTKGKPETKDVKAPVVFVETFVTKQTDFPVTVTTQGEVKPRVQSRIIPEVSGKIIEVSENFFAGKFFKKGEVLLKIDARDYEIAVDKAQSALVKAQTEFDQEKVRTQNFKTAVISARNQLQKSILALKEEKARSEQALADWKRLGREGEPNELVLRKPQLKSAEASVTSAEADIERAERDLTLIDALLKNSKANVQSAEAEVRKRKIDLERCTVEAPFDGRIVVKSVDVGQYVSLGNSVANIYAIDAVEIMLPIAPRELTFVDLPGTSPDDSTPKPEVIFSTELGSKKISWKGVIDRTDSMVDSRSRQYHVIGQVKNPFAAKIPLKPGTFVKAEIKGKTLKDVFILPVSAVRESSYVWVVDEKMKLKKTFVEIVWRDLENAVVTGLQDGQKVCRTALTFARDGLIVTDKKKAEKTPGKAPQKNEAGKDVKFPTSNNAEADK